MNHDDRAPKITLNFDLIMTVKNLRIRKPLSNYKLQQISLALTGDDKEQNVNKLQTG